MSWFCVVENLSLKPHPPFLLLFVSIKFKSTSWAHDDHNNVHTTTVTYIFFPLNLNRLRTSQLGDPYFWEVKWIKPNRGGRSQCDWWWTSRQTAREKIWQVDRVRERFVPYSGDKSTALGQPWVSQNISNHIRSDTRMSESVQDFFCLDSYFLKTKNSKKKMLTTVDAIITFK